MAHIHSCTSRTCRLVQRASVPSAKTQRTRVSLITPRAEPAWKVELSELNDAIRGSAEEEPAEADVQPTSLHLDSRERVYLVGVQVKSRSKDAKAFSVEESLEELGRLAVTAGLAVCGSSYQMLDKPSPQTYIGSGKVAEIAAEVRALGVETVIFDDELSPGQQRNLEKALGDAVRVADRTALILDIFDQRAGSREGKLQVQLAAMEYQLPRLKRMWTHLERQTGAGATRGGMGEKQMEVDKRLLRDKMAAIRKEIQGVRSHRSAYRARRKAANVPVVALVGYTNAGKSTLINCLTRASVLAEDTLFATLDPTTRKATLPSGKQVLISDTVGFIQKLPTQLVAAFRATLEEIEEADILLHVVDVSHPEASKQSETVFKVLEEINVSDDIAMVTVWNKVDATADPATVEAVAARRQETVAVSGLTGHGIDDLLVTIEAAMEESMLPFEALVPYTHGHVVNWVRERGVVRKEEYTDAGVALSASADLATIGRVQEFIQSYVPRERIFAWRQEQVTADLAASGYSPEAIVELVGSGVEE